MEKEQSKRGGEEIDTVREERMRDVVSLIAVSVWDDYSPNRMEQRKGLK